MLVVYVFRQRHLVVVKVLQSLTLGRRFGLKPQGVSETAGELYANSCEFVPLAHHCNVPPRTRW